MGKMSNQIKQKNIIQELIWTGLIVGLLLTTVGLFSPYMSVEKEPTTRKGMIPEYYSKYTICKYTILEFAGNANRCEVSELDFSLDKSVRFFAQLALFGYFLTIVGLPGLFLKSIKKLAKISRVGSFLTLLITMFHLGTMLPNNGFVLYRGTGLIVSYSEIGMKLIFIGSLLFYVAICACQKSVEKTRMGVEKELIELNIKGETTSVTKRITIVVVASILGIVTNYYLIFTEPIARLNTSYIGSRMLLFIAFSAFEGWMVGDFATGKLFSKVKYRLDLSLVVLIGIVVGMLVGYESRGYRGDTFLMMGILAIIGIVLFSNVRSRSRSSFVVSGILTGVLFWVVGLGIFSGISVPDFMEPARFFTLATIGGVIAAFAYILLFTSNNRHTRAIGGTVYGSFITTYGGLLYLWVAPTITRYYGKGVPVQELFQMVIIPLMGAPLGAILGGIIGYLGIRGLYLLKYNAPLAFIGICALAGSVIGFVVSPLIVPDFYILGFNYATLWHFTAAGVFEVMAVWAGVGALAGIMSVRLDHN